MITKEWKHMEIMSLIHYRDKLLRIKETLEQADAVVIGAGAGLSTAAGFVYSGAV